MGFYSCFCYSYSKSVSLFGKIFIVNMAFHHVFAMGQTLEGFSEDLMTMVANIEPVFILNPDEEESISKWAETKSVIYLSGTGVENEAENIMDNLGSFIQADNVDFIFFGRGSRNRELLKNVVNSLGILMDNKITLVIPHGYSFGLNMRLDSRLFLYQETNEGGIILYESYQIR